MRAAAAAPKPLSMFTQTTPGEQLDSALCNATRPPRATPYPMDVGTAMTMPGTRPESTLNSAPSMPATAISTGCRRSSSATDINRHRPATPTSA